MADKKVAIKVETLDRLGESFQESRGITDKLTIEQMIELAKEPVGSAENKLAKYVDGSLTEITAEDLEGATKIGSYAFYERYITSVTIPNSVTSIGYNAFYGCRLLKSITIPNSVTSIDTQAFYSCYFTSITIPNSVTSIGSNVFSGCMYLKSVTIGSGVTSIGDSAFQNCRLLTDFTITSPISSDIKFTKSTELTIDSLKNIINALVDYSGTENEGVNTLTLNSTCKTTLDNEGATAPDGLTWKEYVSAKGWLLA